VGSVRGIEATHCHPPGCADDVPEVPTGHLDDAIDRGLKSVPMRKPANLQKTCAMDVLLTS
jgi:hypothetical protein